MNGSPLHRLRIPASPVKEITKYTESAYVVRDAEIALWVALMAVGAPSPGWEGGPSEWIAKDIRRETIAVYLQGWSSHAEVRKAKRHYDYALSKCVQMNMGLIHHVVLRLRNKAEPIGMTVEDLIQEGSMGLMRALEKFDPTRSVSFATYAFYWVYQAINRAIDNGNIIRIPVAHAPARGGKGKKKAELVECAAGARRLVSTNKAIFSDDRGNDFTIEDVLQAQDMDPETRLGVEEDIHCLMEAMDDLTPRERLIVRRRFSEDKTLEQVAVELDLTRERIRQIEQVIFDKMRRYLDREDLSI